ncbi:hypothetical protein WHI96_08025 [Pseudonocardia tropica]|uniref:Uncharacterized protein n=1 Tax=Pseudonocardia tropica TaxID=681289 RepID=A0ABV1JS45_9PSEU
MTLTISPADLVHIPLGGSYRMLPGFDGRLVGQEIHFCKIRYFNGREKHGVALCIKSCSTDKAWGLLAQQAKNIAVQLGETVQYTVESEFTDIRRVEWRFACPRDEAVAR